MRVARRKRRSLPVRLAWLGLLIFPFLIFNSIRLSLGVQENTLHWVLDNPVVSCILAAVACAVLVVLFRFRSNVIKAAYGLLLLLCPSALFNIGYSSWLCVHALASESDTAKTSIATAAETSTAPTPQQRVLWLIFDELDLRLTFAERPPDIQLPEFDRFRAQAVHTTGAETISSSTLTAIPSLTLGYKVVRAWPKGRSRLRVGRAEESEAGEGVVWGDVSTVFSEARLLGARTSILGIYHPYCRIFPHDYVECNAFSLGTIEVERSTSLSNAVIAQLFSLTPAHRRRGAIITYSRMLEVLKRTSADPEIDFLYSHVSVPHGPNIYDRRSEAFTMFNVSKDGYFDNLVLTDIFLGEIRAAMEGAGLWESTAVFITSDHDWRHVYLYDGKRTRIVPYLVKMPGQTDPLEYDEPFSPVISKDMVLAILKGDLRSPEAVVEWLDAHR